MGLEPSWGGGKGSPSWAWSGIWETADLVLPLLFLLPWLARDACVCNFRWALGPPKAPLPARLVLPSSEGWPEPFASSGVPPKGFPCGWPGERRERVMERVRTDFRKSAVALPVLLL